ncbi:MAG TPA: isoprenylcysteine carboxylmethyltransferase family protein [Mycobacteriales bacterium]|nr:isoprenylcysteine carboxylmethyltransferase family protein [Mycobacteriales bacterium]
MAPVTVYTRILLVALVVVLTARAVWHLTHGDPYSGVLILAYVGWLLAEAPVTFRRTDATVAETATLAAYASSRALVAFAAALSPSLFGGRSGWMVLPVLLFVGGIAVRASAIRRLGAIYTHQVLRRDEHPIATGGPYRFVRHPAYSGMLLANAGFVLAFPSGASVAALVLLTAVLVWRIRREEVVMWAVPDYAAYARGRSRLILGVW